MAFLNPLFLFGLLAAGIPLVIHLWNRRRVVTIDFSSLIFLAAAHRENARRFQLRQLLILLLRVAIIALIALALARPFLTLGLPVASIRAKTDVVIILDTSYSMAYQDINGRRFQKAKTLAIDIIKTLRHGDSAALILMSDIPQPVFRQLTPDLENVIAAIDAAETSYRTTNVQPSLELAHAILAESEQLHREIYLISDFAQNGWDHWGRLPNRSGARISLIPVAEGEAHNISIKEIRPSNQLIGVSLPFQLNVTTVNHSVAPLAQNVLTLFTEGEKQKIVSFSAAANEVLTTALTYNFSTPGTHTGSLVLTADRLNIDNQRYFALEALGEVRVLCVGEETDYLTLALNPQPFLQRNRTGVMILPTHCTPAEFETFPLEAYDVLIFADVRTLSEQMHIRIQEFTRHGKSIIVFASSRADTSSYNTSGHGWLPATLNDALVWTPPQQVASYQETHPIFDIFPSEGFSAQYTPQFFNGLALQPAADAQVLARFGDDTPFLVERSHRTSKVLLYNCGLLTEQATTTYTNDLLVNPYFLPMLQQTVLYAATASTHGSTWNGYVGDTYTAYYPQNTGGTATIRLKTSDETDTPGPDNNTVVPIDEDGTLRFHGTEQPGIYEVEVRTRDRIHRDFFAVNVDTAEADLTEIPLPAAARRIGAETTTDPQTAALTAETDTYNIKRHGREIWGELIVFAICLMLLESFLSNRERH